MTRTYTKAARDLAVGDVFSATLEGVETIVLRAPTPAVDRVGEKSRVDVYVVSLESEAQGYTTLEADVAVAVRAPTLTRAQEHADELARRLEWVLGFCETYAREHMGPATPEFSKVRDVLAQVRPPDPPTYEESLEALAVLSDGLRAVHVGDWDGASMQVARNQAHEIVRRARAAGIIP